MGTYIFILTKVFLPFVSFITVFFFFSFSNNEVMTIFAVLHVMSCFFYKKKIDRNLNYAACEFGLAIGNSTNPINIFIR